MIFHNKPLDYHAGLNTFLANAVPKTAMSILDVGCGDGLLGEYLKQQVPGRVVCGIEKNARSVHRARNRLDLVSNFDVQNAFAFLDRKFDCILYGDILEHLADPETVLLRHLAMLNSDGQILCCVPNLQHHSVITALLRGDFQYQPNGLLDSTHLRFFTCASFFKMLLDCGYMPNIVEHIPAPTPPGLSVVLEPLAKFIGCNLNRLMCHLGYYQFIFSGTLLPELPSTDVPPLSFAVCVNDEQSLADNLLASPCIHNSKHELRCVRNAKSAADGLNEAISRSTNELVVCVHQDVYLPNGWDARFWSQYQFAKRSGPIGVAGVYGVYGPAASHVRYGRLIDRDHLLDEKQALPTTVDTLDEILLAVPREAGLRFDESLGWHLYGADLCLTAAKRGLKSVVIDAPLFHNSRSGYEVPLDYQNSKKVFAEKWKSQLPIATSCSVIH